MNEENNAPVTGLEASQSAGSGHSYVPVEKLDFGQLLSDAWQLGQTKFWNLLGIYLIITVIAVVTMVLAGIGAAIVGFVINMAHLPALLVLFIGLAVLGLIVLLVWVSAWGVIASLRYLDHSGNPTVAEMITDAKPKAWQLVPTLLITTLAVIGGFFFLVIPGIVMGISLAFVMNVAVFENKTMWAALVRSRDLVRGRWWNLFVIFVAFFVFSMIVLLATGASYSPLAIVLYPFCYLLSYVIYKKLVALPVAAAPTARGDWYYKAAAAFGILIIAVGLLGATFSASRNWDGFKAKFDSETRMDREDNQFYKNDKGLMLDDDQMHGTPYDLSPADLQMMQ